MRQVYQFTQQPHRCGCPAQAVRCFRSRTRCKPANERSERRSTLTKTKQLRRTRCSDQAFWPPEPDAADGRPSEDRLKSSAKLNDENEE